MRGTLKKFYISILTIMLIVFTMLATTYAWVGIYYHSSIEDFSLNLKTQKLNEDYYLSISSFDEEDTFFETTKLADLQRQIVKNRGSYSDYLDNDDALNDYFSKIKLNSVTTTKHGILNDEFYELDKNTKTSISVEKSNSFFKFDVYLSLENRYDLEIEESVNKTLDVYLENITNVLSSSITYDYRLTNDFTYPSNGIISTNIGMISKDDDIRINPSSTARVALAIYNPILRNEKYEGTEIPKKIIIFQGGTDKPTYDSVNNVYSFGGILPEEYNLALNEYRKIYKIPSEKLQVPLDAINRGDLELIEGNEMLIEDDFGFGIVNGKKTKIKITVYFWFEGWDSDCFAIMNNKKVELNLVFATGKE